MKHEFDGEPWEHLWDKQRDADGEVEQAENDERFDASWLGRLDAIAAGEDLPSADDDELLHVAGQLTAALTPLRSLDSAAEARKQRVGSHLRSRRAISALKVWGGHSLVVAAALLIFVLLGPGLIFMVNLNTSVHHGRTALASPVKQTTTATTTTRVIAPLLTPTGRFDLIRPSALPKQERLVDSGIDFAGNTFLRYYAQYRITGQGKLDIFLYEQPSPLFSFPLPATGVQTITVHGVQGVSFRNASGYYTIRWMQDDLTCQLASLLPTSTLLAFVAQFQIVTLEHKTGKH